MSHEIVNQLKSLKLHGMAQTWSELVAQVRIADFDPERFMLQLLKSETAEREVRSIAYQMNAACWRRPNFDRLCRLNFDQGKNASRRTVGCG
jgi:hypothetical protein